MDVKRLKAIMVGHAVGDALGVPVEFSKRETLDDDPVVGMRGFGTFGLPEGTWSDDTSMSLCALEAMDGEKINPDRIMKNFVAWLKNGDFTTDGHAFDVGNSCYEAVSAYIGGKSWKECGERTDYSNGNGSLMRIHPFVAFTYDKETTADKKISVVRLRAYARAPEVAYGVRCICVYYVGNPRRAMQRIGLRRAARRRRILFKERRIKLQLRARNRQIQPSVR